ncbi:MAG: glycogen/starch synthase, partial [Alphaproteobacteria bacterium]|nr:glycogen/starch synthase [Alphaproteobacteria bacterium]
MRSIKNLSELDLSSSGTTRPLGVCVVSSEILGPIKNGGIGTATTGLVSNLAANGHKVTILYTQVWSGVPLCQEKTWNHWVRHLGARNIELVYIPHE